MARIISQLEVENFCFEKDVFYKVKNQGGPHHNPNIEAIEVLTEDLELYQASNSLSNYKLIQKWIRKYTGDVITVDEILNEFGLDKPKEMQDPNFSHNDSNFGSGSTYYNPFSSRGSSNSTPKKKHKSEILKSFSQIKDFADELKGVFIATSGSCLEFRVISGSLILAGGVAVSAVLLTKGVIKGVGKQAFKLGKKAFNSYTAPKGTAQNAQTRKQNRANAYKKYVSELSAKKEKVNSKKAISTARKNKKITEKLTEILGNNLEKYDNKKYYGMERFPDIQKDYKNVVENVDIYKISDFRESLELREQDEFLKVADKLEEFRTSYKSDTDESHLKISELPKEQALEVVKNIRIKDGKVCTNIPKGKKISEEAKTILEELSDKNVPKEYKELKELVSGHKLVSDVLEQVTDMDKYLTALELDKQMEVIVKEIDRINNDEDRTKSDERRRENLRILAEKKVKTLENAGIVETVERGKKKQQRVTAKAKDILLSDIQKSENKGRITLNRIEDEHEYD